MTAPIQLVGSLILWPKHIASSLDVPAGCLSADGSAVSRTTYAALFAILGTRYGSGDGSTTFNLPDVRGMFPRFLASGSANDPDRASRTNRGDGTTGDVVGTKQADINYSHTHAEWARHYNGAVGSLRRKRANPSYGWQSFSQGNADGKPKNITVAGVIKYE